MSVASVRSKVVGVYLILCSATDSVVLTLRLNVLQVFDEPVHNVRRGDSLNTNFVRVLLHSSLGRDLR